MLDAKEKQGISYSELERLTGVPRSALQRYLSGGTRKIPYDRLERVREALELQRQPINVKVRKRRKSQ